MPLVDLEAALSRAEDWGGKYGCDWGGGGGDQVGRHTTIQDQFIVFDTPINDVWSLNFCILSFLFCMG